jgi:hypothetical protein
MARKPATKPAEPIPETEQAPTATPDESTAPASVTPPEQVTGDTVTGDGSGTLLPPIDIPAITHTVTATPEKGFWRAGRQWHRTPTPVNRADWSDDQWQALTAEPRLLVQAV